MNQLDTLLVVLLVPFALRGYFRGFCREGFGLAGLVAGALVAAAASPGLGHALVARGLLPPVAAGPVASAALFLGTVVVANLVGVLTDRLVRALLLGGLNRAGGALLGGRKGATLLGFGLLLAARLLPDSGLTGMITSSRLGPPLAGLATRVLEAGRGLAHTRGDHA